MFYDILKKLCEQHGTTVTSFARDAGIAKGSPSSWQRGSEPNSLALRKASEFFGVSTDYLLGLDDIPSRRDKNGITAKELGLIDELRTAPPYIQRLAIASMRAIIECAAKDDTSFPKKSNNLSLAHIEGKAAAGVPLNELADADDTVAIPIQYVDGERFFIVEAKGDSMEPEIMNGDYVVVAHNVEPTQGSLALVSIEGASWDYEYAIKLVYFCNDEIELHSYNEKYDTMTYPLSAVRSAEKIVHVIHKS